MEQLNKWDHDLLVYLNQFHNSFWDPVMYYSTRTEFWLPLYALLIFFIFKYHGRSGWFWLAGAALTILLSDQLTSSVLKPWVARLRPSQDPSLAGIVHLVNGYKGGLYGFASSHAANTFGTACLIWLSLRRHMNGIGFIFLWSAFMTYTRIYLGVHFPGDILVGAIIGLFSGWAGAQLARWLEKKYGQGNINAAS